MSFTLLQALEVTLVQKGVGTRSHPNTPRGVTRGAQFPGRQNVPSTLFNTVQNRRQKVFNRGGWHYEINQNSTYL